MPHRDGRARGRHRGRRARAPRSRPGRQGHRGRRKTNDDEPTRSARAAAQSDRRGTRPRGQLGAIGRWLECARRSSHGGAPRCRGRSCRRARRHCVECISHCARMLDQRHPARRAERGASLRRTDRGAGRSNRADGRRRRRRGRRACRRRGGSGDNWDARTRRSVRRRLQICRAARGVRVAATIPLAAA